MTFLGIKTTKDHTKYWSERKIDWGAHYLATWNHPHREAILRVLKGINWFSLWEVGCGPGANLVKILKDIGRGCQLGGSDVNPDAIVLAKETLKNGLFHVESGENMMLSDKSVDIILSDASLIYVGPLKINKYLKEYRRVARNSIVFFELHERSWWRRLLLRLKTGYNAYDYRKLLEKNGYHSIDVQKISPEVWPGTPWQDYGHIITARV